MPLPGRRPARRGWCGSASAAHRGDPAPLTITVMRSAMREHRVHVVLDEQDGVVPFFSSASRSSIRSVSPVPCRPAARRAAARAARWPGTWRSQLALRPWTGPPACAGHGASGQRSIDASARAPTLASAAAALGHATAAARRDCAASQQFSEHREAREDGVALVAAADAGARAGLRQRVTSSANSSTRCCRGRQLAQRRDVDQRRLAGAVGADDGVISPSNSATDTSLTATRAPGKRRVRPRLRTMRRWSCRSCRLALLQPCTASPPTTSAVATHRRSAAASLVSAENLPTAARTRTPPSMIAQGPDRPGLRHRSVAAVLPEL